MIPVCECSPRLHPVKLMSSKAFTRRFESTSSKRGVMNRTAALKLKRKRSTVSLSKNVFLLHLPRFERSSRKRLLQAKVTTPRTNETNTKAAKDDERIKKITRRKIGHKGNFRGCETIKVTNQTTTTKLQMNE